MPSIAHPTTPFAIAPRAFRFGALAAAAEKRREGGEREALMATFVLARLVDDTLRHPTDREGTNADAIAERAAETNRWLASLALPAGIAADCTSALGALLKEDQGALSAAWERLVSEVSPMLDAPSRDELAGVSAHLL